jgi:hypothetical protein
MGPFTLLPLLGWALYLRRRLDVDPAIGLLCASSVVILTLYVGALADVLLPVAVTLYVLGCLSMTMEIIRLSQKRSIPELPVPLAVLAVAGAAYWLRYSGTEPFFYDEYAQWGISLKELLAHDKLWGANTNVPLPRLVPGAALFQYWFARFSPVPEGSAYLAQFTLMFVPMLCLLSGMHWRQAGWIAGVLTLCLIAATHLSPGFSTLYLDHLLGSWFAGSLLAFVLVRHEPGKARLLTPALALAVLALLKRTGFAFAVAAGLLMAAVELARGRRSGHTWLISAGGSLRVLVLAITPAIACTLLWEANRDAAGAVDARPSIVKNTVSLERLLTSYNSDIGQEVTARFMEVARDVPLGNNEWFWQLNEFNYRVADLYAGRRGLTATAVLVVFTTWWIGLFLARRSVGLDRDWWIIASGCLLIGIAYAGQLYCHYLLQLGPVLPSYTRYMNSMVLALLLVSLAPLLPAFRDSAPVTSPVTMNRQGWWRAGLFFAGLGALYWHDAPEVSRVMLPNPPIEARRQLEPVADEIRQRINQHSIWIYYPDEDPRAFNSAVLAYLLTPARAKVVSTPDLWMQDDATIAAAISGFDYLLILDNPRALANNNPRARQLGLEPGLLMRVTRNDRGDLLIRPAIP